MKDWDPTLTGWAKVCRAYGAGQRKKQILRYAQDDSLWEMVARS